MVVTAIGTSLTLLNPGEHVTSAPPGRAGLAALVIALIAVPFAVAGLALPAGGNPGRCSSR